MSTAKGQIGQKDATVFWMNFQMLAPDTKMPAPLNWLRIECRTVQETEFYSRKLAMQEFEKYRSMKVEEHIRYKAKRDQMRTACTLRLAQGCISEADEIRCRHYPALVRIKKDELLYKGCYLMNQTYPEASLEVRSTTLRSIKQRRSREDCGSARLRTSIPVAPVSGRGGTIEYYCPSRRGNQQRMELAAQAANLGKRIMLPSGRD